MNKTFEKLGFYPADILLPKDQDMTKWAVVACDQFTSEPEYWQAVEEKVGKAPSTLRLILPEANLKAPNVDEYISGINAAMEQYLKDGVFQTLEDSLIYVERQQSDGRIRHGLIGMVDLDAYDFTPGSGALIRATEGTVLDRIPPRAKVRRHAPIELPHVMLLVDDPDKTVIEPLTAAADTMEKLYDFDLMQNGGHIRGYKLSDKQVDAVAKALEGLASDEAMQKKYGVSGVAPLLFAVGDGNHSLATAKACYEEQKKGKTPEEYLALPSRFALVEVVNNHDDALQFEPIHRVLFGVDHEKFMKAFQAAYPNAYEGRGEGHTIEFVWNGESHHFITVPDPKVQLAVGTLQGVIDPYLKENGGEVDYIHGDDVTRELGSKPGNMGFLLPAMGKEQLFKTVMADGVLPRKLDDNLMIYYGEFHHETERAIFEKLRTSPYRNYVSRSYYKDCPIVYLMGIDLTERMQALYDALGEASLLEQVKVRFYPAAEYPGYSYLKIYERSASREAMLERLKQDLGMERSVVLTTQEGCGDVVIRGGANQAVKRLGRLFEPYLWEQK